MKKIITAYFNLCDFSKTVLHISTLMCLCLCIVSCFAYIISPFVSNYFAALLLFRGAFEAAHVTFAAGVTAALICDIVVRKEHKR